MDETSSTPAVSPSPPAPSAPSRGMALLLLGAGVLLAHAGLWTAVAGPGWRMPGAGAAPVWVRMVAAGSAQGGAAQRNAEQESGAQESPEKPDAAPPLPPLGEGWDGGPQAADSPPQAPTPALPQRGREARASARAAAQAEAAVALAEAPPPELSTALYHPTQRPDQTPPGPPHQAPPSNDAEPLHVAAKLGTGAAQAASTGSAIEPVPVYRTRIPPTLSVHYTLHKGMVSGRGELQWRLQGGRYQARLEGRALGMHLLTWASEGGTDAAGLAPVRFTEKRIRKSEQAANFQRALGKITYSGPSVEYPLLPGAQDRLSWMVQLAAIAAAEPQRVAVGQHVSLFVSGAKGDADVWAFRVVGSEPVAVGSGTVPAIKLLREPRKPHDTRVEVWLGPQQYYLPVRVRLSSSTDGEALEFELESFQPPSS